MSDILIGKEYLPRKNVKMILFVPYKLTKIYFLPILGCFCSSCTSVAPQRPTHGTVPSQMVTPLGTGKLGRGDARFEPESAVLNQVDYH